METTVSQVVQELTESLKRESCNPEMIFLPANPKQPWVDLELDEAELAAAIDNGKREKYYGNEQRLKWAREVARREAFLRPWTAAEMYDFIWHRAQHDVRCRFNVHERDGRPEFVVREQELEVYKALCYYFTGNPRFEEMGTGWKLTKGLLMAGPKGTGKTSIMRLFNRNKRNCYEIFDAKAVAKAFTTYGERGGYEGIKLWEGILHMPKCEENFYNDRLGVCFDDFGTEEEAAHYANRLNVLGYLIETRYSNNIPFHMTHMTTNLSYETIGKVYGERVQDRIKEMFNVIRVDGVSRR